MQNTEIQARRRTIVLTMILAAIIIAAAIACCGVRTTSQTVSAEIAAETTYEFSGLMSIVLFREFADFNNDYASTKYIYSHADMEIGYNAGDTMQDVYDRVSEYLRGLGWIAHHESAPLDQYDPYHVLTVADEFDDIAIFILDRFRIEYITNGGNITLDSWETTGWPQGTELTLKQPPLISREGYEFGGWYRDPQFRGLPVEKFTISQHETFYARWISPTTHSVFMDVYVYDDNVQQTTLYQNSKDDRPEIGYNVGDTLESVYQSAADEIFRRTGYYVTHFGRDTDFEITNYQMKSDDNSKTISVYFVLQKWFLNYETMGGSIVGDNWLYIRKFTQLDSLDLPGETNVIRPGYKFRGWYRTNEYIGDPITRINKGQTTDITVYAKWEQSEFNITWELDGGTMDDPAAFKTKYSIYDGDYVLPTTVSKPQYRLQYWYVRIPGQMEDEPVTKISAGNRGDVTIYAKWKRVDYTISWRLNGATMIPAYASSFPDTYNTDSDYTISHPDNWYIYPNHEFRGWYSDPELTTPATGIPAGTIGSVIFYAKWEKVSYNITWEFNGAYLDNWAISLYPATHDYTEFKLPVPTKPNASFLGWYKNADFSGAQMKTIPADNRDDLTLYAKWGIALNIYMQMMPDANDGFSNLFSLYAETVNGGFIIDETKKFIADQDGNLGSVADWIEIGKQNVDTLFPGHDYFYYTRYQDAAGEVQVKQISLPYTVNQNEEIIIKLHKTGYVVTFWVGNNSDYRKLEHRYVAPMAAPEKIKFPQRITEITVNTGWLSGRNYKFIGWTLSDIGMNEWDDKKTGYDQITEDMIVESDMDVYAIMEFTGGTMATEDKTNYGEPDNTPEKFAWKYMFTKEFWSWKNWRAYVTVAGAAVGLPVIIYVFGFIIRIWRRAMRSTKRRR